MSKITPNNVIKLCINNESWENYKTVPLYVSSASLGKHLSAALKILFDVLCCCQKAKSVINWEIGLICLSLSWTLSVFERNIWVGGVFKSQKQKIIMGAHWKVLVVAFFRRPLVPASSSIVNLTWKREGLIYNAWKGPAAILRRTPLSIPPLSSVAHSRTVHVPWLHGGWVLKYVWQNNIFGVACNLLVKPVWKEPNLPAGQVSIISIIL